MDKMSDESDNVIIGLSQEKISPPFIVKLFHFDEQERNSRNVLDDIYAKVLYLKHDEDSMLLINLDLIWLSKEWAQEIKNWIGIQYKIPAENILISATHSHSTPSIRFNTFNDSGVDEKYISFLTGQVHGAVEVAINSQQQGYITISRGISYNIVNRRKRILDLSAIKRLRIKTTVANRPNSKAPVDNSFSLIKIYSTTRKFIGAIINIACHPSIFRGNGLSADFPGYLSELMKKRYGSNFVTLFLQGFAGNVRPKLTFQPRFCCLNPVRSIYQRLFDSELFVKDGKKKELQDFAACLANDIFSGGTEYPVKVKLSSCEKTVELPLSEFPEKDFFLQLKQDNNPIIRGYGQYILQNYSQFKPIYFSVQRISLAKNIVIIALEGEIFTEYALWLRTQYCQSGNHVLPVSCANGMVSYIPDSKGLKEGGYESERAPMLYGLPSKFSPHIEDALKQGISEVMPW